MLILLQKNLDFLFPKLLFYKKHNFKLINDILTALNDKRIAGGIFFDLEKAFNCVNHDILLAKPEHYGIRCVMYASIKNPGLMKNV
jgi:hypothetical protein